MVNPEDLPKDGGSSGIPFNYNELKNDHYGQGSGRIPHFDGTFYEHWK